ncbi:unnamed protein product [Ectocarpus sp. CCAP 1310/34]|nr:unnamed protein product [Ectocarpus sp. CCAP 1310/34]
MWNSWATMWKSWVTNPRARLPPQSSFQRPVRETRAAPCSSCSPSINCWPISPQQIRRNWNAEAREKAERDDAEQEEEREAAWAAAARKQAEDREAARAAAARKQAEDREAARTAAARKQAEKRGAARAAAARKQVEDREAARAAAARKQEEERAAALAEREAYLQAARAKQGALRSRLEDLEPRHQHPRAAAVPSPYPRRRIIVRPPTQSQVPLGSRSTASPHEKEREVAATPTNEKERERATTPEFSVTLGLPAGAEDGASFPAATTVYEFHVGDTAFLSRPLEMPASEVTFHDEDKLAALFAWAVGRRLLRLKAVRAVGVTKIRRPRAGRTTTAAPPGLREGAASEITGEGKPWGTSLPGLRRRAAIAGAGVGAQNVNSTPILRRSVGAAGAETVVGETCLRPTPLIYRVRLFW